MIRYRLWVLCLVFPTWVWAENTTRTCTSFTQQGRQVTFHLADSAALQLQLCSSSVVKIWFSPDGQLQRRNTSFAVINEELEEVGTIHVDEQAACYEIFTPKLRIRVNKSPMSLQIFDKYQKLLFSDYADKGHVSEGTKKVEYKVLRRDEHFFGLGEKAGKMDRRGESYKMWNSDKPCYSVVEDPLYKSIPFFMSNYRSSFQFDLHRISSRDLIAIFPFTGNGNIRTRFLFYRYFLTIHRNFYILAPRRIAQINSRADRIFCLKSKTCCFFLWEFRFLTDCQSFFFPGYL